MSQQADCEYCERYNAAVRKGQTNDGTMNLKTKILFAIVLLSIAYNFGMYHMFQDKLSKATSIDKKQEQQPYVYRTTMVPGLRSGVRPTTQLRLFKPQTLDDIDVDPAQTRVKGPEERVGLMGRLLQDASKLFSNKESPRTKISEGGETVIKSNLNLGHAKGPLFDGKPVAGSIPGAAGATGLPAHPSVNSHSANITGNDEQGAQLSNVMKQPGNPPIEAPRGQTNVEVVKKPEVSLPEMWSHEFVGNIDTIRRMPLKGMTLEPTPMPRPLVTKARTADVKDQTVPPTNQPNVGPAQAGPHPVMIPTKAVSPVPLPRVKPGFAQPPDWIADSPSDKLNNSPPDRPIDISSQSQPGYIPAIIGDNSNVLGQLAGQQQQQPYRGLTTKRARPAFIQLPAQGAPLVIQQAVPATPPPQQPQPQQAAVPITPPPQQPVVPAIPPPQQPQPQQVAAPATPPPLQPQQLMPAAQPQAQDMQQGLGSPVAKMLPQEVASGTQQQQPGVPGLIQQQQARDGADNPQQQQPIALGLDASQSKLPEGSYIGSPDIKDEPMDSLIQNPAAINPGQNVQSNDDHIQKRSVSVTSDSGNFVQQNQVVLPTDNDQKVVVDKYNDLHGDILALIADQKPGKTRENAQAPAHSGMVATTPFNADKMLKRLDLTRNKLILLFTDFFSSPTWEMEMDQDVFRKLQCPVQNCVITANRHLHEHADALLFHMRDWEDGHVPTVRHSRQRYVFFSLETPLIDGFEGRPSDLFNWTMSYRRDSDIRMPYGTITRRAQPVPEDYTSRVKLKSRPVAWMVSNCKTPSLREKYVEELQKYIEVDVYGDCGPFKCSRNVAEGDKKCLSKIDETYWFYLSFESSLCEDYATEKYYQALQLGVVPVVRGLADYSSLTPDKWYIDTRDYKTPEELAAFLHHLMANPGEYIKYLQSKEQYDIEARYGVADSPAWCDLCAKLNRDDEPPVVKDLKHWWSKDNSCKKPADVETWFGGILSGTTKVHRLPGQPTNVPPVN